MPTSWSILRSTKSSDSCRSKRCSPAHRSSSPTIRAAEKSCAPPAEARSCRSAMPRRWRAPSTACLDGPTALARGRSRRGRARPGGLWRRRRVRADRRAVRRDGSERVMEGVSFVVPVHNGAACIRETLEAILAQADGRPMEIIVVDDRSRDGSSAVLRQLAEDLAAADRRRAKGVAPPPRSTPACARRGFRSSARSIRTSCCGPAGCACWRRSSTIRRSPRCRATTRPTPSATLCARAMGLDLEQRYAAIDGR